MHQTGKDVIGFALQTALGSPASQPAFAHGLESGGPGADPSQETDPLTSAHLAPAGAHRDEIATGAQYVTRAWPKSVGAYLYAVLGDLATTGTGPYEHVITLADDDLPYVTVFSDKDGTLYSIADCKLDELKLSWEGNKPVKLEAKFVGAALDKPATFVATVDETDDPDYFSPLGGTFKMDVDSATPATARVKSGSLTISRGAEPHYFSGSVVAGDVTEGGCAPVVDLTLVPEDLSEWEDIVWDDVGEALEEDVVYGSFEFTFVKGTNELVLAADRVAFVCELPEADPEGGAAELELTGVCYRTTDTPVTATLTNGQATY